MDAQERAAFFQRMAVPFEPQTGVSDAAYRQAIALEYIAYKLGQIEKHMAQSTSAISGESGRPSVITNGLQGVATAITKAASQPR